MSNLHLKAIVLAGALLGVCGGAVATADYQVTFDVTTDLQNVFVYADEFNGQVYAWDLFPAHLGTVSAGKSTFQLGNHNLMAWAILATHRPSGVATGINDAGNPPDGVPFETVFPGYAESTVEYNIVTLYTGGAYNVPQAFFLTESVLAVEDTLKTDFPTGALHMYAFSGGINVGTATFSVVLACRGDFNCDRRIDFTDIDAFVAVLSGGACCDPTGQNCEVNGDGAVNFGDIDPFVALLSAGATCP